MKVKDILHEVGSYFVIKTDGLFVILRNGLTHSVSVDGVAYYDISIAIARTNYLAERELTIRVI